MNWAEIGGRIRAQREYLGYTREQFAERLGVTPKFCSDIELGVKGMSVPTLCKIAQILRLSTDFILFGALETDTSTPLSLLLKSCSSTEQRYAEQLLKTFLITMRTKKDPPQGRAILFLPGGAAPPPGGGRFHLAGPARRIAPSGTPRRAA